MAESSSSGLHRMLDAVGNISGQQGFRVWNTKLWNAVNLFAPDLKPILAGADSSAEPEPDKGDKAKWDQANSRPFSLLFFVTSGSAHAAVLTHEEAADGTAAWKALNERFDAHTQEARRVTERCLAFGTWRAGIPSISSRKEWTTKFASRAWGRRSPRRST